MEEKLLHTSVGFSHPAVLFVAPDGENRRCISINYNDG